MPELPEVEGFRRRLAPLVIGRRIERLAVLDHKAWLPAEGWRTEAVAGRQVRSVGRRAKLLLVTLDGAVALVVHLKIAGQLVYQYPDGRRIMGGHPYPLADAALPDPSTRFIFDLEDGATLYMNDQRRFAWLRLLPETEVESFIAAQRYGPDPLDPTFTPEVLAGRLRARKGRPVKAALLDQTCIAGLGNIYADEALHAARLHPATKAGDLIPGDVHRLYRGIVDVLNVAVPVGGAIVKGDKAVPDTASGREFLRAHGRAGEACPDCTGAGAALGDAHGREDVRRIVRVFLAGRGTYFCPACQPAPPGFVLLAAPEAVAGETEETAEPTTDGVVAERA